MITLFFISSCSQPFDLKDLVDGPDGKPLTISPTSMDLQTGDKLPIQVSGGIPPYQYIVVSGEGHFVGNLYQAPYSAGVNRIVVKDKTGRTRESVFTVENAGGLTLGITPRNATVFTGGTVDFAPLGGKDPFTFSLTGVSGGEISNSTGVYTAGCFAGTDTILLTDSNGDTTTAMVTVQAKPLAISPANIAVYTRQTVTFAAVGGDGGFSFSFEENASGAVLAGNVYTAGETPGVDRIVLRDAYDGREVQAFVTVHAIGMMTNVDYEAGVVESIVSTDVLAGSAFDAEFQIENVGTSAGTEQISWTVYASLDTVIGGADDRIVASGTLGPLGAGVSATVKLSDGTGGTWPTEAGAYFLLLEVIAPDDLVLINNRSQSLGTIQIYEPVKILPAVATLYPGQSLSFSLSGGTEEYDYNITQSGSGIPSFINGVYTAGESTGTDILEVKTLGHSGPGWTSSAMVHVILPPAEPIKDVDYIVSGSSSGGNVLLSEPRDASFTVKNQGTEDGIAKVYWKAYLSEDRLFDSGDMEIDSGSLSALAQGGSSVPQVVQGGTWDETGIFYLLVDLTAADEGKMYEYNNLYSCGSFVVMDPAPTQPDYKPQDLTMYFPHVFAGASVDEFFTLTNVGSGGSGNVSWTAYASMDQIPDAGEITGTGIVGPLAAGGSLANISLSGAYWPAAPGDYYLIVKTEAADESSPGDYLVSTGKFTVSAPPDYIIENVNIPVEAEAGTPVSGGFHIRNSGMGGGKKKISWKVYLSFDQEFSDDDFLLGGGEIPPLAAGKSAVISSEDFSSTVWPVYGACYIIIKIAADDDSSPANNTYVSPYTELYVLDQEGPGYTSPYNNGNGVNTTTRPIPGVQNIEMEGGSLKPGQTLVIRGWADNKNYDTYKFLLDPEVDLVYFRATWSTGTDLGDIYMWYDQSSGDNIRSLSDGVDSEPESGWYFSYEWTMIPNKNCYASFRSKSNVAGDPYKLYVWGKP